MRFSAPITNPLTCPIPWNGKGLLWDTCRSNLEPMAGLLALYFQAAHDGGQNLLAEVRGLLEAELGVAEDALEKVLLNKLPCRLEDHCTYICLNSPPLCPCDTCSHISEASYLWNFA